MDWLELGDYSGGRKVAGDKLKETGTANWDKPNTGATDEMHFTALPAGYRSGVFPPTFDNSGYLAIFWSATEYKKHSFLSRKPSANPAMAWCILLYGDDKKYSV